MLLTPSVSNRSRVPSQVATSGIQFDLKHVKIQPAIVNYYGKKKKRDDSTSSPSIALRIRFTSSVYGII